MGDISVRADSIGKRYEPARRRGLFDLRERMSDVFRRSLRSRASGSDKTRSIPSPGEKIWALKNVYLEVRRGEVVGMMGRNGSGKTTLMKILARITEPTEGSAAVLGRVGTLLDVGAGLHGELSGRENVFLNAAIHGMRREEIRSRFDEIVAFSELEQSIDQPLKYFSSGMCLRLAFTVASFLRSRVLLVDEVLAQADPRFQQKCLKRMSALAMEGHTVLVVSHDLECLRRFCTRGIVFSAGHVVHDGAVDQMSRFVGSISAAPLGRGVRAEELVDRVASEAR
jgi:homopolymeric O-antigen transport system ATP-binding protein